MNIAETTLRRAQAILESGADDERSDESIRMKALEEVIFGIEQIESKTPKWFKVLGLSVKARTEMDDCLIIDFQTPHDPMNGESMNGPRVWMSRAKLDGNEGWKFVIHPDSGDPRFCFFAQDDGHSQIWDYAKLQDHADIPDTIEFGS